jgi:folate-binding protein YgfZ
MYNRRCLLLKGDDIGPFLQGLITQDVLKLNTQDCIYSLILTPQGRYLSDIFIHESLDLKGWVLDVPTHKTLMIELFLQKYKMRRHIEIQRLDSLVRMDPHMGIKDPRHPDLGCRLYGDTADTGDWYHDRRFDMCLPDDSDILNNAIPLEMGLDTFNGISFDKGCYLGQEFTAMTKYKNLNLKKLSVFYSDILHKPLDPFNGGVVYSYYPRYHKGLYLHGRP